MSVGPLFVPPSNQQCRRTARSAAQLRNVVEVSGPGLYPLRGKRACFQYFGTPRVEHDLGPGEAKRRRQHGH
eukprot:8352796-Prorocentrum_lima.AAC.1